MYEVDIPWIVRNYKVEPPDGDDERKDFDYQAYSLGWRYEDQPWRAPSGEPEFRMIDFSKPPQQQYQVLSDKDL